MKKERKNIQFEVDGVSVKLKFCENKETSEFDEIYESILISLVKGYEENIARKTLGK